MNIKSILRLHLLLFIAISCDNQDDTSDVVVTLPIDQYEIYTESGNIEIFNISAKAYSGSLSNITITEQSSASGIVTLLEESVQGGSISYNYSYQVPDINTSNEERKLRIAITNDANYTSTITSVINISSSVVLATEISNINIYGAASGEVNGYSFYKGQLISVEVTEDCYIDIYDYPNSDTTNLEQISREWRSKTEMVFARLSGFNYGEATVSSISTGYSVAEKLDRVTNLSNDETIFIGIDKETPLAAIKINNIYDEEGTNQDRYYVSMKVLDVEYPAPEIESDLIQDE